MGDEAKKVGCFIAVILVFVFGFAAYEGCWVTIPQGHVGVKSNFGSVSDSTLEPGWHTVSPWATVFRMNCQTHKLEEPATVPTKNGLAVQMKATLLFHLKPDGAPKMAREVGDKDYAVKVIEPVFNNTVRDVAAEYAPEAFYTSERSAVEAAIMARMQRDLESRGVVVEAIMLLDPQLPQVVTDRIQAKVAAEQDVIRMEYVLKQKQREAKAKVVEAEGIAQAQKIIKADLNELYIEYLWVMALKEHQGSLIYVPTGSNGLPVFASASQPKK